MMRQNAHLTQETIRENKTSANLPDHQISPIVTDLCRRGILEDNGGEYTFALPLFRDWTAQSGINKLIADNLGDELAASAQKAEDDAFVKDGEIADLIARWPPYRGRPITVPDIRAWLEQLPKFRQQRLFFKLLENVRIFSELEVREKLRLAHSLVLRSVPEFVRRSPADRRRDIVVTYVDGAAKSGHYYAARYAEENLLASSCVKEMGEFGETLVRHENESDVSVNGLVIIDDFVGTGRSLRDNLLAFVQKHREAIAVRNMSVVVVALCATAEGEATLRKGLTTIEGINIELRICEPLNPKHMAFGKNNRIWDSPEQEAEAKALCLEYGSALVKNAPLGYNNQGLLVVFPQTCPNNSLPIIHAWKTGRDGWKAPFPRPKN